MRIGPTGVRRMFSQNIQFRLTCYFLILLLPLTGVGMYAVEQSKHVLYDQAVERSQLALSSTMDSLDLTLLNVEQLSTIIATDPNVISLLEGSGAKLTSKSILDFAQILKQMSNIKLSNQFVQKISIYHEASNTLLTTGYGSRQPEAEERQWLTDTINRIGSGILYESGRIGTRGGDSGAQSIFNDRLSLVRSMDLYNQRRQPNALIISLDQSELRSTVKSLLPTANAYVSLYGQDGSLIVGEGSAETAKAAERGGSELLSVTIRSNYSNWQMTIVQPKHEVFRRTESIQRYLYLIAGLSIVLAFIISWTVYKGIASPVKKLMKGMKQISAGMLDVKIDYKRKDELGFLTETFNQMTLNQKHLIENHYEQQLHLAQTELKFLQSQINPHFLYNTLDSIYWTSQNYEAEEIGEMVLNLSKFFRLSLNKGNDVITVRESIEHLNYYVRIQQLKFLDSFEVEYRIGPEAAEVPVLKLLLQPLVENAILHGMEGCSEGGRLAVGGRVDGEFLELSVADNGRGMTAERIAYVQAELGELRRRHIRLLSLQPEEKNDLFGLRNVMTRIRLCYGEEADLTVGSREGEGTKAIVRLPLERCRYDIYAQASLESSGLKGREEKS
ncbi:sensor histidine kinase [Cohnella zeiphila]|uniref:Sensor histidine kinase n=1 Tax=Cohnella zeiphila TaxID=2761120 RepID=A0A7X0SGN0_9BACL|nr:sensor histidine kinase [Cohnella zeiphila]MBB6729627.1 sensor histidine kinase [Cohnella zeiphila]